MKTLILTKQELDSLPIEIREAVVNAYNAKKTSVSDLKKRISNLPYLVVSSRSDHNCIADIRNDEKILTFRIWEKTEGENWGNNRGNEYQFRIGTKYIRMDISNWATNRGDWDGGQVYVSADKLAEIVDLLEEAYSQESEVDRDRLLLIACSRVENLAPSYY